MNKPTLCLLLFALASCQAKQETIKEDAPTGIREISTPVKEGGEPNLFVAKDGQTYLSWVEYLDDRTDALLCSRLENDRWSEPAEIARGTDWFVNWADFPSVAAFQNMDGYLAAHWLQKSAEGTYDYDVRVAVSKDGGKSWSNSFTPHTDGVAAEHGFVTLLPLGNGRIFAAWLDGRNTKGGHNHGGAEHGRAGAMTLRAAEFDENGQLYEEAELDNRVCDCCQTDAALTANGPVVIYRDRSEEEVRDISIVRRVNGRWTAPQKVFDDRWKIAGCPVNGPAIAAHGQSVAIAWFTAADTVSQVKVIFSEDAGATFTAPVRVDDGAPLGRVDIAYTESGDAVVSWMENVADGGEIRLAKVNARGKVEGRLTVAKTGASRRSGFPVLEMVGERLLLAWTHVDSATTVKTMSITF
jgi:hypothetical protein